MSLLGMLALGMILAGIPKPVGALDNAPFSVTTPAAATTTPGPVPDSAKSPPNPVSPGERAQASQDSAVTAQAGYKSRSDTVLVVKHSFNHRQQIIAGSVIMTCLMLMMATMNNYNPR